MIRTPVPISKMDASNLRFFFPNPILFEVTLPDASKAHLIANAVLNASDLSPIFLPDATLSIVRSSGDRMICNVKVAIAFDASKKFDIQPLPSFYQDGAIFNNLPIVLADECGRCSHCEAHPTYRPVKIGDKWICGAIISGKNLNGLAYIHSEEACPPITNNGRGQKTAK